MVRPEAIRALLVEDNPGDATLTQCLLAESLGSTLDTTCAERLSSAVSRLEKETFDVVILDLLLPDARGLEALKQIVDAVPSMPVVILTGLDDNAIVTDAFGEGAQEFLVKGGVLCEELGRAVEKAIYRKRAEMAFMQRFEPKSSELIYGDDIISPTKPAQILVIDSSGLDCVAPAVEQNPSFFVLHEAQTFKDARQALACRHYDAILLNPELPDAWPNDVCEHLLESGRDNALVVLTTSWTEPCLRRPDIPGPFAIVQRENASPNLLRRLLIAAVLRNRALEPTVDADIEGVSQTPPNVWRH